MSHQGGLSSRSPASVRNSGFGFAPFIGAPSTNHLSRILKMLLDVGCCEDWGSKPLPGIVPRLKFPRPGLRIVCIRLESRQNTSRNVDSRQRIKPGQRGGGRDFTESPIPTFGRLCTVENAAWGSRGAGMDLAAPGLCTLHR